MIVRSASVIARVVSVTCDSAYPDAVAVNRIVSWSSVTVSEAGVTVMSAYPLADDAAIVTVAADGAE